MPRYTVLNTMLVDGPTWEIHVEGCRHLIKEPLVHIYATEAASASELIKRELETLDPKDGWTEDDFRVAPCARKKGK